MDSIADKKRQLSRELKERKPQEPPVTTQSVKKSVMDVPPENLTP